MAIPHLMMPNDSSARYPEESAVRTGALLVLPTFRHRTVADVMNVMIATDARKKNSLRCHFSCRPCDSTAAVTHAEGADCVSLNQKRKRRHVVFIHRVRELNIWLAATLQMHSVLSTETSCRPC